MNTLETFLQDLAETYTKNRDLIVKKILSIEKNDKGFLVKYKDKEVNFFIIPLLKGLDFLNALKSEDYITTVVLNTTENLDFLIKNWNSLCNYKNLSLCFVNPFSTTEKKWIIHPYIHSRICDESSLKQGLRSMFETVELVTNDLLKNKKLLN